MNKKLDAIDYRILSVLQKNARITIVDLASQVNLTKTPCAERLKRLENEGFIEGYKAILNTEQLGLNHLMGVQVTLSQTNNDTLEKFNLAVKQIPEIQSCLMVAANFDYLLLVRTRDIGHFRKILGEEIGQLPSIQQTHSFVVMEEVIQHTNVDLTSISHRNDGFSLVL